MAEKHITGLGRSFNYCFGWKSNPSRFVFFISVNSTQLNIVKTEGKTTTSLSWRYEARCSLAK